MQVLWRRVDPLKVASDSNYPLFSRHTIKLVHRTYEIFLVLNNLSGCLVLLDAAQKYSPLVQFSS